MHARNDLGIADPVLGQANGLDGLSRYFSSPFSMILRFFGPNPIKNSFIDRLLLTIFSPNDFKVFPRCNPPLSLNTSVVKGGISL